jgi:hypothetical protein
MVKIDGFSGSTQFRIFIDRKPAVLEAAMYAYP